MIKLKALFFVLGVAVVGIFGNCINVETRQKYYFAIKYWNAKGVESTFIKKIREGNYNSAYSFTSNSYKDSNSFKIFCKTADSVRTILNKCHAKDTLEIHESWSGNSKTGKKSAEVTFALPFECDEKEIVNGYYDAINIMFKQNGSKIEEFEISGYFVLSE